MARGIWDRGKNWSYADFWLLAIAGVVIVGFGRRLYRARAPKVVCTVHDDGGSENMKILVVGRFYQEAFASFVAEEFEELSHEVVCFDPGPYSITLGSRLRHYANRLTATAHNAVIGYKRALGIPVNASRLRRLLESETAIDLVLVTHDYLTFDEVRSIRGYTKAPIVLWYPDPIWSFQRHMFLNAPYDMLFFKDPYIVDIVRRKLGKCSYYLPECFSPRALQQRCLPDVAHHVIQSDICTAGNMYAFRAAFFENLADKQVKIWGLPAPRWLHLGSVESMMQNRWVANEEKAKAFLAAKIVLNNLNPAEIWGTNVRTFEICGAGAFQITDWRPGLSQLFDLERELVTFDDVADLRRKVDYYLGADKERRRIAEAGHQRAMRDHTYAHRLSLLLETVAGRKRGFPEPSIAWSEHVA